jgi:histidinol phosphatase-like PHP family hydrolase
LYELAKEIVVVAEEEEPVDILGHRDLNLFFFISLDVVEFNENSYVEELDHENGVELAC